MISEPETTSTTPLLTPRFGFELGERLHVPLVPQLAKPLNHALRASYKISGVPVGSST